MSKAPPLLPLTALITSSGTPMAATSSVTDAIALLSTWRARLGLETKQLHRRQSEGSFEQRELEGRTRRHRLVRRPQGSDDA